MKQDFLNPTLDGDRFSDHTVPLELLRDFSALQDMLIEVAKWEFRQANPDRERIPRNFTNGLDLHLEQVSEGSAILKISLVFASLLPSSNLTYFEQAKASIIQAVAAAEVGRMPSLPPRLLNYFDRFGRGLKPGESISFVNGEGRASLTPETRQQLMRFAEVDEWTEQAVLRVRIPAADKGRNTFEIELADGTKLPGNKMGAQYREAVLQAFDRYCSGSDEHLLVQGIIKQNRENQIKGFESIEHATQLDPLDVSLRLDQLAELHDGWLDGHGTAPNKKGLRKLSKLFDTSFDTDLPLPFLYPTPSGGVQAEWNIDDWSISLEMDLDTLESEYQALNLPTGITTERTLLLGAQAGWERLNDLLKHPENQPVKEPVGDKTIDA